MSITQIINQLKEQNNKNINIDQSFGSQCFDWSVYAARLISGNDSFYPGCEKSGGVKDWRSDQKSKDFWLKAGWVYEENDFTNVDQVPPLGSIFVEDSNAYNPWGHTGVIIETFGNQNKLITMEQNIGSGDGEGYDDRVQIRTRDYAMIAGWFYYPEKTAETKPTLAQENLPPKMTTKQGLQELLRYYPEFTAEVENGWPIARFDIDGAGEGLKMVAEQVLQPMYNRNTNLQAQLKTLTDNLPVKKNESPSQKNPNPIQAEIKSDQVYLGTDSIEIAQVKTNIIEGQADVIQFQKNQEIKELITNPYVIKAETSLWKSKTILTNLGGFGAVISLLGSINIPSIKASLDQVVGADYCNYLILAIVILIFTNVLSILYKITDKKVLNQDNLLKLISFGQTTLATSQDLINQGKDLAEQANKIQTTFYNSKK